MTEVARSPMFSTRVPKYLWGEAILTSAYLINRLPSCALKFETPRQALIKIFPHARVLSSNLPFKFFGCSTFVYVYPQNMSKLYPRSIKCVFIGCSANKKGYKCFCLTRRVFEIMDVTFFKQNPYFSKHKIQGENKKELPLWSGHSLLEQPQALESIIMSNSSLLSTELLLSSLCVYVPDFNSHSFEPNIPSSSMSNPISETRELYVYTRRKRQSQGEIETLTHLTPIHECELDLMIVGTST